MKLYVVQNTYILRNILIFVLFSPFGYLFVRRKNVEYIIKKEKVVTFVEFDI